ncbi:metallophosphoesterase [Dyella jejuensis]|uniref:Metallophosphoesterase n=1 Tax=Dyella jejuensis TaxID=1432009 RepID=A0ABW8JED4_9GAMM
MRLFAISDLHLDYGPNLEWLERLPLHEYNDDVLILAGDLSDRLALLEAGFKAVAQRFSVVLYVPGNHDLWVTREGMRDSFEKWQAVCDAATGYGIRMDVYRHHDLAIVPLLGWYDYSFGIASDWLKGAWADYRACRWPAGYDEVSITRFFTERNPDASTPALQGAQQIITFSHFLPRIDLMPARIPERHRRVYPVLGTSTLEHQLRTLRSRMHVYGHSHVNRRVTLDGVTYVNNAFGYPSEAHFAARELLQVYGDGA